MELNEKRLKKRLSLLVKRAAEHNVPLSQIPAYLESSMKRNGVSADRRHLVLQIAQECIHQLDYRLLA